MKLIVSSQDLDPFSQQYSFKHNLPSGILSSRYKSVVKYNFNTLTKQSLFSIKQRIKSKQYNTNCAVSASLKISLFVLVLLMAFN